jgi:catechol 2,3-dioxygenase-like lactoylglutathione lyase family enzyme
MARSVRFYRSLGFALTFGGPAETFTTFQAGSAFLNLQLLVGRPPQAVWGRVIFWVDDVDEMHRRIVAAGVTPEAAPVDAPWAERYFHVRDPDGHELSIAQPIAAPLTGDL